MIDQLRERNFILCYLGADNYAFVHRTFLEYFCASEFVWQFEKKRTLREEDLRRIYDEHFQDEAWAEVLKLMAGMLDHPIVDGIITFLVDRRVETASFIAENPHTGCTDFEKEGISNLLLASECLLELSNRKVPSYRKLFNKMKEEIRLDSSAAYTFSSGAASALVNSFAASYQNSREALNFLKEYACNAENYPHPYDESCISAESMKAVAKYWRVNPDTLPWIMSREIRSEALRVAAVESVVTYWRNESIILPWLKDAAESDSRVASVAIPVIAEKMKHDPDTLPWLK